LAQVGALLELAIEFMLMEEISLIEQVDIIAS
jgi:hypothetical protein